jgi:hypothetical protein
MLDVIATNRQANTAPIHSAEEQSTPLTYRFANSLMHQLGSLDGFWEQVGMIGHKTLPHSYNFVLAQLSTVADCGRLPGGQTNMI